MKYLSLFSGIGGFELGIQQAYDKIHNEHAHIGAQPKQKKRSQGRERATTEQDVLVHLGDGTAPLCVGYSEIDKYAVQIYRKHFPNHKNYGDITKINEKELPEFDLIVGGFPCQSFSIAGKRRGFEDTRGTLFFDIARIIKAKRPRLLLLENVKGLLSHDKGDTFRTIIATLDELGYDIQWQVLNSKNHGVPQNRERIIIVGHLRGTSRPKVFPFTESDADDTRKIGEEVSYAIGATYHKGFSSGANGGKSSLEKSKRQMIEVTSNVSDAQRIYKSSGIAKTLKGLGGGLGAKTGMYQLENLQIRRLTPIECERLQGFPDNWTKTGMEPITLNGMPSYWEPEISDTQRYKCCGNAVTVNVIQDVMERVLNG